MNKFDTKLILILLIVLCSISCNSDASKTDSITPAQTNSEFPVTVIDDQKRKIEILKKPVRIVSLLPSHTEILFAVGAGDQMVGCTTNCNFPPETSKLKKVSLTNPGSVSLETLVAMKPDLVLLGGDYHRGISEQLTKLKIPVLSFDPQSMAAIQSSIQRISVATGHVESGDQLIQKLDREMTSIQKQVKPYQKQGKPRVFYQVWDQPLMTAGPTSFIGELIQLAGGDNIFKDVKLAYPQVSEESLIVRNPDVILLPRTKGGPSDAAEAIRTLSERSGWKQMNAVKNKRVYLLEDDLVSRPGPRVVLGLQKVAQALYPEAFPKQ